MRSRNPLVLMLMLAMALMLASLGGCNTIVTVGADVGATTLLQKAKPADRPALAITLNTVAHAVSDAAQNPPDYTALNKIAADKLATINSPYAPLISQVVSLALANVEHAPPPQTPQAATARDLIQAAMLGIEIAATPYLPSPAPAPVPVSAPTTNPE